MNKFWNQLAKLKEATAGGELTRAQEIRRALMPKLADFWGTIYLYFLADNQTQMDCHLQTYRFFIWLEENLDCMPWIPGDKGINTAIWEMCQKWGGLRSQCPLPAWCDAQKELLDFAKNYPPWAEPERISERCTTPNRTRLVFRYWFERINPDLHDIVHIFAGDLDQTWERLQQGVATWKRERNGLVSKKPGNDK